MQIDHSSRSPLHVQAENILRKLIESEEYKNGKLLPNEVTLSEQLGISRNTLRQAINKLVFEGLLQRKKGVGTKVVKKGIRGGVKNWMSFSQEMKTLGIEIRNFELHLSLKQPTGEISDFFEIPSGSEARSLVLERVRGKKEYPFVYFISYFNPNLPLTGEENFIQPLYEMLENEYHIIVKTSKEEISARLAGDFIGEKLDIKSTEPILIRKRYVYDIDNQPIEYNIGYYRADSFTYTIEAERQ
ncbi:MAG: GntR family transcriptional regulator [Bacteroidetes bacterium GWD2_45_23]|nr:MAG: GntR family transcriptional regulator [Bacteroidetes bacterium GWC2_46_850]OFX67158.1 MAG: GntR family transcriptional regulator [Bacteroidetes bacterium GWC1_47_7]OFX84628.1 MAG: GntR family transcriptional regulator [Bacteroidetes bacterium GWD2_45_23]HAR39327.1 GntR family transcriptional regulator [Porphyromonadaceae bacterium]HBB00138.1 GntR family transcriptional regulator [Porphyromonadaceae bacterium]